MCWNVEHLYSGYANVTDSKAASTYTYLCESCVWRNSSTHSLLGEISSHTIADFFERSSANWFQRVKRALESSLLPHSRTIPAYSRPREGTFKSIKAVYALRICRSADRLDGYANASTDLTWMFARTMICAWGDWKRELQGSNRLLTGALPERRMVTLSLECYMKDCNVA